MLAPFLKRTVVYLCLLPCKRRTLEADGKLCVQRWGLTTASSLQRDVSGQLHWGSPEASMSGFIFLGWAGLQRSLFQSPVGKTSTWQPMFGGGGWEGRGSPGCPQCRTHTPLCLSTAAPPSTMSGSSPVQRPLVHSLHIADLGLGPGMPRDLRALPASATDTEPRSVFSASRPLPEVPGGGNEHTFGRLWATNQVAFPSSHSQPGILFAQVC